MMARKIPIKVTTRVRVQRQIRTQHHVRSTGRASFAAWQGPVPQHTTNNYGDTNTITGEGHQVAIGVSGSVTQISGPPPVDPARLAAASQQLLELLDQLPISEDERDGLRDDAEDVLDAAASADPDQDLLRARGRSMVGVLGKVGTAAAGGTIAQLLGHAMMTAMGGA
jgi:hypothetical protein